MGKAGYHRQLPKAPQRAHNCDLKWLRIPQKRPLCSPSPGRACGARLNTCPHPLGLLLEESACKAERAASRRGPTPGTPNMLSKQPCSPSCGLCVGSLGHEEVKREIQLPGMGEVHIHVGEITGLHRVRAQELSGPGARLPLSVLPATSWRVSGHLMFASAAEGDAAPVSNELGQYDRI